VGYEWGGAFWNWWGGEVFVMIRVFSFVRGAYEGV